MDGGHGATMDEIEAMEKDVDRLQWLIARKHGIFLRYPSLAAKESISLPESNLYFLVSRQIERISDHAVSIAKICGKYAKCRAHNPKMSAKGAKCLAAYDNAIKALFDFDIGLANSTIDEVLGMSDGFDAVLANGLLGKGGSVAPAYVVGSLRRIADYSVGICENTIDYSAQKAPR
jgi:phosphate uptake regulator